MKFWTVVVWKTAAGTFFRSLCGSCFWNEVRMTHCSLLANDPMNIKEPINRTQTGRVVWWLESSQSHMCNLICVIQRTFERERLFVTVREHSHVFMQERRLPVYNNIISDKCTSAHIKSVILRSHERRVKKGWKWAEDRLDEERTRYRRKKKEMNELINGARTNTAGNTSLMFTKAAYIWSKIL